MILSLNKNMEKKEIRKEIKKLRLSLTEEDKNKFSEMVFSQIEHLPEFISLKNILLYYSLPDELPTLEVIKRWSSQKNIFLPRVNGEYLDILRYDENSIEVGAFDIEEPIGVDLIDPKDIEMIIVPAVAFDVNFNRLGRGKGYYDRLLSETKAIKIGVGYDFQLFELLPAEPHDIPMDIIITPNNKLL